MTAERTVKPIHPFEGGRSTRGITQKHVPLIWENMLGTVYALNAQRKAQYFDYNYAEAHAFAEVAKCTDLRVARAPETYQWTDGADYISGPRRGKLALWGVRPTPE